MNEADILAALRTALDGRAGVAVPASAFYDEMPLSLDEVLIGSAELLETLDDGSLVAAGRMVETRSLPNLAAELAAAGITALTKSSIDAAVPGDSDLHKLTFELELEGKLAP